MISITYLTADDVAIEARATPGQTLMDLATTNNVPGIVAECGGNISCATCHVYVEGDHAQMFGAPSADEADMLEFTEGVTDRSRLSCQLVAGAACDGVRLVVPLAS